MNASQSYRVLRATFYVEGDGGPDVLVGRVTCDAAFLPEAGVAWRCWWWGLSAPPDPLPCVQSWTGATEEEAMRVAGRVSRGEWGDGPTGLPLDVVARAEREVV